MAKQTNAFIRNATAIHNGSEAADAVRDLRHQDTSDLRFMALADVEKMMYPHCTVIWCVGALAVVDREDYGYRKVSMCPVADREQIAATRPQDFTMPAIGIACGINKIGRGYFGTIVYDPAVAEEDYQVTWQLEVGHEEHAYIATCFPEAYLAAKELGAFNKAP